jgi:hypothetical protein
MKSLSNISIRFEKLKVKNPGPKDQVLVIPKGDLPY